MLRQSTELPLNREPLLSDRLLHVVGFQRAFGRGLSEGGGSAGNEVEDFRGLHVCLLAYTLPAKRMPGTDRAPANHAFRARCSQLLGASPGFRYFAYQLRYRSIRSF